MIQLAFHIHSDQWVTARAHQAFQTVKIGHGRQILVRPSQRSIAIESGLQKPGQIGWTGSPLSDSVNRAIRFPVLPQFCILYNITGQTVRIFDNSLRKTALTKTWVLAQTLPYAIIWALSTLAAWASIFLEIQNENNAGSGKHATGLRFPRKSAGNFFSYCLSLFLYILI